MTHYTLTIRNEAGEKLHRSDFTCKRDATAHAHAEKLYATFPTAFTASLRGRMATHKYLFQGMWRNDMHHGRAVRKFNETRADKYDVPSDIFDSMFPSLAGKL